MFNTQSNQSHMAASFPSITTSAGLIDLADCTTVSVASQNTLSINGRDADILINGVSLTSVLKDIQDKLNILRPNKELEAEWDQLRDLGEQYRALEAQLLEKMKMWKTLSK